MFGLGKKNKGFDILLIKLDREPADPGKVIQQIIVPGIASSDFIQLMAKLQHSNMNSKEYLGEYGGFTILSHIEGAEKFNILDTVHPEAEPIPLQDFANLMVNRLNAWLSQEEMNEEEEIQSEDPHEDLVFFIGEFTLMKDGSF